MTNATTMADDARSPSRDPRFALACFASAPAAYRLRISVSRGVTRLGGSDPFGSMIIP